MQAVAEAKKIRNLPVLLLHGQLGIRMNVMAARRKKRLCRIAYIALLSLNTATFAASASSTGISGSKIRVCHDPLSAAPNPPVYPPTGVPRIMKRMPK